MAVAVTDINALAVLNDWALDNGHDAPVYDSSKNTVQVAGVSDLDIKAVLDAADSAAITAAQSRSIIRSFQMMLPRPKNATLAEQKTWALGVAVKTMAYLRSRATGSADAATLSGWVDKLRIAQAIVDTTATPAEIAILQAEADIRGLNETAAQLAAKVIAKGDALRVIRSKIDGFEDRVFRDLQAAADVPAFNAVVMALMTDGAAIIAALP